MEGSPFRERRVSPDETRRIVARAVALGALDTNAKVDGPALTEAELAQRLGELGLADDAIRRAMESPEGDAPLPSEGPLRVVRQASFEGTIAPEGHEALAEAMSSAMGSRGRVEVVGNKLTWTPGGMLLEPALTVHTKDGRTHLRVEETIANRGQVVVGSVTAAIFAALFATAPGIGIAKSITGSETSALGVAIALGFSLAWALAAVLFARKLFKRRLRNRTEAIDDVMTKMTTTVRGMVTPAVATALAAAKATDTAMATQAAEAEAEAEAEAAESEVADIAAEASTGAKTPR